MPRPLIAITDSVFPSLDPAKKALARLDPEYRMANSAAAADILAVAHDADAILVTYAKLPGDLLRQLKNCKAIGRFGLGVDNIDLPAAKELGIAVNYVPDYCLREVSDHAMALLLALARKVPFANKLVQAGRWEVPPIVPLRRLEGQVLGLIGFGNIPRALAPKAKAFGLQVADLRSLRQPGRARRNRRRKRKLRRSAGALGFYLRACPAAAGDPRPDERQGLRQDEEGRLPRQHRARPPG